MFDTFNGYGWLYIGSFGIGLGAMAIALTFKPVPRPAAARHPTSLKQGRLMNVKTIAAALAALCVPLVAPSVVQAADPAAIARGKYLVTIASCHDCHTPGYFLGKPDMARYLGGSDVGFEMPGLGIFLGPNLTPDKETGLGNWTDAQIVAAIQKGAAARRPHAGADHALPRLRQPDQQDVQAIVAFLRSIPPVPQQGAGSVRPDRDPDLLRHEGRAAGNAPHAAAAEVGLTGRPVRPILN